LFYATNGHIWKSKDNWLNERGLECTWKGISCDAQKHVVKIKLDSNNLSGEIPKSFRNLEYLC